LEEKKRNCRSRIRKRRDFKTVGVSKNFAYKIHHTGFVVVLLLLEFPG
jgi:hypothetical protein